MRRLTIGLVVLSAGCQAEPEVEEPFGERAAALIPVTWTDVVGASAVGNDLTKTAPENNFNAGAASVERFSGDGYVEFTTGENTTSKDAGLSRGNGDVNRPDIDFAIQLGFEGFVQVYESGVLVRSAGTYVAGDVFRVQVVDGVVTYWRNGVLFYTSAATPTFPLRVDTSLKTPGATIRDVVIQSPPFWQRVVGASAVDSDLSKTASQTQWNAGAISIATIPSGDGYAEFTVADNTTLKAAGLSRKIGGESYVDIRYAIHLNGSGRVAVYEGGTLRGTFGTYAAGDVFQVQVVDGIVSYWRDGEQFYESALPPIYPLRLDAALRTPGTAILDASITTGLAP